jgi:type I restriction enzyme, S subunit
MANGITRFGLSSKAIRTGLFPIPSFGEQDAIAAFLDRETARIDALIAKKERLIELLQEKRTALITHAVTKGLPAAAAAQAGLDPDVPMKDSGVEWLGGYQRIGDLDV